MSRQKQQEKHSEFQELVASIHSAESEADRVKSDYEAKTAELLRKGRKRSVELCEAYEKKAAEAKNRILSTEREKTSAQANEVIAEAKKQAAVLRSKKLDRKGIEAVFEGLVSSL